MEATLVRVFEEFSIQGYEDWSYRVHICLQAHPILMWDVVENDPTLIYYAKTIVVEGTSPGDAMYAKKLKNPQDYTIEERKEPDLDKFVK